MSPQSLLFGWNRSSPSTSILILQRTNLSAPALPFLTQSRYSQWDRIMCPSESLSPEAIIALALGIPAFLTSALSLWVAYLTFAHSRHPLQARKYSELSSSNLTLVTKNTRCLTTVDFATGPVSQGQILNPTTSPAHK